MASRVLGAFAVTATATLASLALATPASAHTDGVKAYCDEKTQKSVLSVELSRYGREKRNTVEIVVDNVVVKKETFGESFPITKWENDGKTPHKYKVTVTAYDDPNGFAKNPDWSKVYDNLSTEKCDKTPPKPEQPKPEQPKPEQPKPEQPKPEQPKPEEPKPPVETTTEAPSSSATPPAPGGSTPEPPLAATGASPLWLLVSGVGLVGAGAGTLLFLRRRRSA